VTDVSRALAQIAAIHDQLAKAEIYRGWRSLPVAGSGLIGIGAAAWQSVFMRPLEPLTFAVYWIAVAIAALFVGCAEIVWHYVRHAGETDRRRSRRVIAQFLPALLAGVIVSAALVRLSPALVVLLPGLWSLLFGVGIFATRPYVLSASVWVARYYWAAGLALLWVAGGVDTLSP
jgi:hypothetical protein